MTQCGKVLHELKQGKKITQHEADEIKKTAKPRPSKKSFEEIAKITFKKHEKSFERLRIRDT